MPIDLLTKAYEVTIDGCKGKFSYSYMAKVLDNWHLSGLKTLKDVENSLEQYNSKKQKLSLSSYDIDDFFEAALERSNEEMKTWRKK